MSESEQERSSSTGVRWWFLVGCALTLMPAALESAAGTFATVNSSLLALLFFGDAYIVGGALFLIGYIWLVIVAFRRSAHSADIASLVLVGWLGVVSLILLWRGLTEGPVGTWGYWPVAIDAVAGALGLFACLPPSRRRTRSSLADGTTDPDGR